MEFMFFSLGFLAGTVVMFIVPKLKTRSKRAVPLVSIPHREESELYAVYSNGTLLCKTSDLTEAKRIYKSADYSTGNILEFYNRGNHVATRVAD